MSTVLQLLTEGERLDTAQMATILDLSEAEVAAELKRLEAEHVLLGWRPCSIRSGLRGCSARGY